MSFRHTACLVLCAAAGLTVIAAPASACDNPSCLTIVQPEPEVAQPAKPAAKPLRLSHFARKPIATAAVRAVKTRDGHYAQASLAHHVRGGARTKTNTKTDSHALAMPARPPEVAVTPAAESLPAAAAQAFASVPYATARVRVVTPEELKEIGNKADEAAFAPAPISSHAPTTAYNGVQVVSADAVNAIDLKADTAAHDAATAENAAASETRHENATLLQRMLMALGGAFVTAAAAVKALIG